jgi:hypothetical protein
MGNDTRIEECRRLEGILVQKIGSDKLELYFGENGMRSKSVFQFGCTRFEYLQQIAMATLEILKDIGQLSGCHLGFERQDPVDDMVRPRLVCGVEVPRFGCWFEWPHDHPRRVGTQIKSLPVQERGL